MARDQRRLATIVSADVAGYSRLMGRDESGTLITLKAHRRELRIIFPSPSVSM
jgi:class 3 adenylate cyclase